MILVNRDINLLLAFLAMAWGVFLIEDGLFNAGSADLKEFAIGVVFILPGLINTLVLFCKQKYPARMSPWPGIGALVLLSLFYTTSVYSRWSNRGENTLPVVSATAMIAAHVNASDEWLMIHKSLLQRPAHWYESGVLLSYLGDERQPRSILLPAKFLPLKSIKEM